MLVGDLVYSDDFDCNCNYAIYDCTDEGKQYGFCHSGFTLTEEED